MTQAVGDAEEPLPTVAHDDRIRLLLAALTAESLITSVHHVYVTFAAAAHATVALRRLVQFDRPRPVHG